MINYVLEPKPGSIQISKILNFVQPDAVVAGSSRAMSNPEFLYLFVAMLHENPKEHTHTRGTTKQSFMNLSVLGEFPWSEKVLIPPYSCPIAPISILVRANAISTFINFERPESWSLMVGEE